MSAPAFRFIDLFAGVGGFHAALKAYGGECEYAVEIDKHASAVYERNWGHDPLGDITDAANDQVVTVGGHEVLAAGFPCQPFSKSGFQQGMDETRGTLYWNILRIIEERKPKVVLLENVRNLAGPRHLHEWKVIIETLREQGYYVATRPAIFSPHLLPPERGGRPQVRERVFITATHDPDGIGAGIDPQPVASMSDSFGDFNAKKDWDLEGLLDDSHNIPGCELSATEEHWINAWDEWVQNYYEANHGQHPAGFPFWADSWAEFDKVVAHFGGVPELRDLMDDDPELPSWKASHLAKNYALYAQNRVWIDPWIKRWKLFDGDFPPSRRKLEWQAQDTPRLWDTVMHFRPSGIRAKKPTYLPALVAITQTSIIGPRKRRISPRETARLQGLPDDYDFGDQRPALTYKQMGNGVNVGVVWHVFREHVLRDATILMQSEEGRRILEAVQAAPICPDEVLAGITHTASE